MISRTLIHSSLGNEDDDEDSDRNLPARKKRTKYLFDTDDDGHLILPDPDGERDMKLMKMEQLVRAFLTEHYRKPNSFRRGRVADSVI
jgi:hypothetical protein